MNHSSHNETHQQRTASSSDSRPGTPLHLTLNLPELAARSLAMSMLTITTLTKAPITV
jgi:hypothetical protein